MANKTKEQLLGELTEVQNIFHVFRNNSGKREAWPFQLMLLFFLFQPMMSKSLMV